MTDLSTVYPLARKMADKGIHINVANNDEMLTRMTMPEFRCPAIYDLGGGKFKFEMNCENEDNSSAQTVAKLLTSLLSEFLPDSLAEKVIENNNPSVTGDLNLMLDWVDVFDGHGIAIFPKDMTTSQVDRISKAAFKRGIDQVSLVTDTIDHVYNMVTIIPKNYSFEKEFGNIDAFEAVHKLFDRQVGDYEEKGLVIENPKIFYDPLNAGHSIREVINTPDELILVAGYTRPQYQWVIGYKDAEIEVNGVRYKATKTEGMEGFEDNYFWSPATMGIFVQTLHFPPIPKDVKTIDFYDCSPTNTKKMIQVTEDDSFMNDVRSIDLLVSENLKTTHVNDDVKDYFRADRVDFFKDKTVINCLMHTHAAHSVPGHVGNDFTLTLGNGKVIKAKGIEGVPADKDFDRHGDWIRTPFQVVFPVITEDEWNSGDGKNVLKGSVMHEPMTLNLNAEGPKMSLTDFFKPVKSLEKGEYKASVIKQEKMTIQGMDLGWMPKESFDSVTVVVKENGDIEISGDKTGHIADGTYFLKVGAETERNGIPCSEVELVSSNTRIKFEAYSFSLSDKLSSILFNTPTTIDATINGVEVPDDADVWQLALAPKQ